MSENKQITRKDFLKGMGYTAASVVAVGSISGLLTGCTTSQPAAEVDTTQAPAYPWTYKKIDPAVAEAAAYKGYKEKGGWGVGVAEGFFGVLANEVGYPYNQIPTAAFTNYGAGFQQAALCGSLGVAAACIGTVCEPDVAKKMLGELENWYKEAELPIYQPDMKLTTTVANSILCNDSVGLFMEKTGYEYGSDERKTRCAGVAADVTKKMVELLNAHFA